MIGTAMAEKENRHVMWDKVAAKSIKFLLLFFSIRNILGLCLQMLMPKIKTLELSLNFLCPNNLIHPQIPLAFHQTMSRSTLVFASIPSSLTWVTSLCYVFYQSNLLTDLLDPSLQQWQWSYMCQVLSGVPHLMKSRDQSPDNALVTLWIHLALPLPLTFLFLSLPMLLQLLRIPDFPYNSPSRPCLGALPLLWSLPGMLLLHCPYVWHLPVCLYSSVLAKRPSVTTHVNTTIPMPSFQGPLCPLSVFPSIAGIQSPSHIHMYFLLSATPKSTWKKVPWTDLLFSAFPT